MKGTLTLSPHTYEDIEAKEVKVTLTEVDLVTQAGNQVSHSPKGYPTHIMLLPPGLELISECTQRHIIYFTNNYKSKKILRKIPMGFY